mgnify:CR=1 FL=1
MVVAILFTKSTGLQFEIDKRHLEMVKAVLPDAEVILAETPEELQARDIDPDILITWVTGGGHFTAEQFCRESRNLKWIHGLSAGVEGVTLSSLANRPGLRLTNAKGIHGIPISEHVLGFLLWHARQLDQIRVNQRSQLWKRFVPDELYGHTLSILGMGSIASAVAKRAKAFGMTVLGVKRTVTPLENVDEVLPENRMDEAIARADYLVMLLPSTPETQNTMDCRRFALMKDGAFFINVGRGATVDTNALVDALNSGKLSGAALDALDPEPLPAGHPLWDMDNVLISPHMSAESPRYMDRAFAVFADNASFFLRGEHMPTEIDLTRKY